LESTETQFIEEVPILYSVSWVLVIASGVPNLILYVVSELTVPFCTLVVNCGTNLVLVSKSSALTQDLFTASLTIYIPFWEADDWFFSKILSPFSKTISSIADGKLDRFTVATDATLQSSKMLLSVTLAQ
jgi:hypothetical protein